MGFVRDLTTVTCPTFDDLPDPGDGFCVFVVRGPDGNLVETWTNVYDSSTDLVIEFIKCFTNQAQKLRRKFHVTKRGQSQGEERIKREGKYQRGRKVSKGEKRTLSNHISSTGLFAFF